MYEEFYGLNSRPFNKTPDPRFLFFSKTHEEALARLHYAVEEREIVMLTGGVGCGKTTLTRALMDRLDDRCTVVNIINPRLTPSQFLRTIAKRLGIGISYNLKADLLDAIYEKFYNGYEAGNFFVIIIDEAQLIPNRDTFEEIRLLTNFQLDHSNLISLILVGQPDLRRRLDHKSLLPLKQRVGLFYHLDALSNDELKGYVEYRLRVSGREGVLFTDEALECLYLYSKGIPRLINSIATSALLDGFAQDINIINERLIEDASKELGLNGYRED